MLINIGINLQAFFDFGRIIIDKFHNCGNAFLRIYVCGIVAFKTFNIGVSPSVVYGSLHCTLNTCIGFFIFLRHNTAKIGYSLIASDFNSVCKVISALKFWADSY